VTAGRALDRIRRIMDQLSPTDRRSVFDALKSTHFHPMTSTERTRRQRLTSRDASVPLYRDGSVSLNGTPASQRDETAASHIPPHPPVVSGFFEQFWSQYPKRVGKGAARASWNKQHLDSKAVKILDALGKQGAFINREGGKFTPNPATWLNQNRWEDEPPQPNFLTGKTSGNVDVARRFIDGTSKQ